MGNKDLNPNSGNWIDFIFWYFADKSPFTPKSRNSFMDRSQSATHPNSKIPSYSRLEEIERQMQVLDLNLKVINRCIGHAVDELRAIRATSTPAKTPSNKCPIDRTKLLRWDKTLVKTTIPSNRRNIRVSCELLWISKLKWNKININVRCETNSFGVSVYFCSYYRCSDDSTAFYQPFFAYTFHCVLFAYFFSRCTAQYAVCGRVFVSFLLFVGYK